MPDVIYPQPTKWYVRALRFANMLDDQENKLSPVKINVWAANITVLSTAVAAGFAWFSGHLGFVDQVFAPVMTWLTHAHTVHHFDKRERSVAEARMAQATNGAAPAARKDDPK